MEDPDYNVSDEMNLSIDKIELMMGKLVLLSDKLDVMNAKLVLLSNKMDAMNTKINLLYQRYPLPQIYDPPPHPRYDPPYPRYPFRDEMWQCVSTVNLIIKFTSARCKFNNQIYKTDKIEN